ncbi:neither inactivation nor afterpotential protein G [Toxorhynchites rutilus septentrionalis]|uniref:neither inactivation nor afterpotential protein G n=1 Tax=Toxorhynchites rutilus septentrionalis TaxID=329112 RepID=UPI00247A7BE7|nr:neither inactivation nor afterpotential protein G [Toxorhynchites rutilus septentrionalis]
MVRSVVKMGLLRKIVVSFALLVGFSAGIIAWIWIRLSYEHIPNRVLHAKSLQNSSFDFIIVGAGTAGCVLANRLSSIANVTVLLIEAGEVFGPASIVPLLSTTMQQTEYDWSFRTTPQKYSSHGLINNQQFLPRGRGLGGSGQINYLLHFTGIKEDFERWERLGALDWGYERMKPYFEKREKGEEKKIDSTCNPNLNDDEIFEQNQYPSLSPDASKSTLLEFCATKKSPTDQRPSSDTSNLHISTVDPETNHLTKTFIESSSELGPGYSFDAPKYTIRDGIRWSSYHEYLRPTFSRPNLFILTGTIVQKIIFDEDKRAIGVAIDNPDTNIPLEILARKEVILSAGAIQTPQLLKLSGVGPSLELKRHRLPVVHDSPNVGQNYFDHMNLPLFVSINTTASVTLDKILNIQNLWKYLIEGEGVLANTAVAGIGSHRGSKFGIILFGMGSVDEQALRHVSNFKADVFRAFFPLHQNTSQEGFLFLNTCHQPKSRGAVYLRDTKMESKVFVNPNYLKDKSDVDCMIKAIRIAAKTVETEPFKKIDARIHWPVLKRCSNFGPFEEDLRTNRPSDRYLECILRVAALTGHHPGGTASIGLHSEAVVENYLRVNGVSRLRVVDASVFPAPVSGTPNSIIIAVAEKAADLIMNQNSVG